MKREVRRIEPWSAVRVGFFFGLIAGFLFGVFNGAIIKYFAGVLGEQMMPRDMLNMVNLSGGAIVALAIIMSLITSLIFAVSGAIAAICYNIIARLFGGLEVTIGDEDLSRAATASSVEHDDEESRHE